MIFQTLGWTPTSYEAFPPFKDTARRISIFQEFLYIVYAIINEKSTGRVKNMTRAVRLKWQKIELYEKGNIEKTNKNEYFVINQLILYKYYAKLIARK